MNIAQGEISSARKKHIQPKILSRSGGTNGEVEYFFLMEGEICLCNIYAPNTDSPGFFQELKNVTSSLNEKKIMIGDYGLVLNKKLDRNREDACNNERAANQLKQLCEEWELEDTWRCRNENVKRYSWYKLRPIRTASRIDFALISKGVGNSIEEIFYFKGIESDHAALYVCVHLVNSERGPGFWKFNNALLLDNIFVQKMNQLIEEKIYQNRELPHTEQWELLKDNIRLFAKDYSRQNADETKIAIAQLMEQITHMEENLEEITNNEDVKLLEASKMELSELIHKKTRGVIFRSRAQWYTEGEKNSKYFFSLEKMKYNSRTCKTLILDDNTTVQGNEKILEEQRKYYESLFAKDDFVDFQLENKENITVDAGSAAVWAHQIQKTEIAQALKSLNNDKTPGPDGITTNFFKMFWSKLESVFYSAVLDAFENGKLYESALQGIINVIPKANKDTRKLHNLRPITLLNVDYKIL